MTVIVGIEDRGQVTIGADCAGLAGWSLTPRADPKVFRNREYVIGFTTSFRMGQLLRYVLEPPALDTWDVDRFMVARFVPAVRTCLTAGGFTKIDSNREDAGTFLVGVRGRLYTICNDFQVGRSAVSYDAVGAGGEVAIGSLHTTSQTGHEPGERVLLALQAAEAHSGAVAGPFAVVTSPE